MIFKLSRLLIFATNFKFLATCAVIVEITEITAPLGCQIQCQPPRSLFLDLVIIPYLIIDANNNATVAPLRHGRSLVLMIMAIML